MDARLQAVTSQLLENQKTLAESHGRLDDQFAVLTRLTISSINRLIERHNLLVAMSTDSADPKMDAVTYEEVNALFHLFDAFKSRPDFRQHFRTWYMGGDLLALPELPAGNMTTIAEEVVEAKTPAPNTSEGAPEEEFPEGAQVFGGDYAESTNRNGGSTPQQADREAHPVSQL